MCIRDSPCTGVLCPSTSNNSFSSLRSRRKSTITNSIWSSTCRPTVKNSPNRIPFQATLLMSSMHVTVILWAHSTGITGGQLPTSAQWNAFRRLIGHPPTVEKHRARKLGLGCVVGASGSLPVINKCLANAKRPCDCRVLCLRLKSCLLYTSDAADE